MYDDEQPEQTERIGMDIEVSTLPSDPEPSTQETQESDVDDSIPEPSPSSSRDRPARSPRKENTKDKAPVTLSDPVIVRPRDYIARTVRLFLLNYPDERDNKDSTANIRFYNNEIRFRPYGLLIDEFHLRAMGRFRLLEQHHGSPHSFHPC